MRIERGSLCCDDCGVRFPFIEEHGSEGRWSWFGRIFSAIRLFGQAISAGWFVQASKPPHWVHHDESIDCQGDAYCPECAGMEGLTDAQVQA